MYAMQTQALRPFGTVVSPGTPGVPAGTSAAPTGAGGLMTLPEFNYTPTAGLNGTPGAHLGDYYGQMANSFLPQVDQFAKGNAGQMVAWNPDQYMTVADFMKPNGQGVSRGHLRGPIDSGYFLGDSLQQGSPDAYYMKSGDGYARPGDTSEGGAGALQDGAELFTSSYDGTNGNYTSAGIYRAETADEALNRSLSRGGAYNTESDFGGDLTGLTKDQSHKKWGGDAVNMPELAPYINNPNWVQRSDTGDITAIRAELLPYVFRDELSAQFRELNRGGTRASVDFLGHLIKAVVVAGIGWAAGPIVASALGPATSGTALATTTAGTATGIAGSVLPAGTTLTTAGSMVAGGVSGGLSAAMNGGNIGQGILTGGIGGGLATSVSSGIASTGMDSLAQGTLANSALTGGVVGAARSAATGGDIGTGFIQGAGTPLIMGMISDLPIGSGTTSSLIGNLVSQSIGYYLRQDGTTAPATTSAGTPAATTTTTPTTTTTTPRTIGLLRPGQINYVSR